MKILNLFILVLFFSLVSCNEWLNVSLEDQIGEKDLFSNGEGFRNALNGIYKSMAEYELYGRQLSWGLPEAMAQTYDYTWATSRSNDLQFTSNYDWTNSHLEPIIDKTWSKAYNVVANCNNLIQNIEKADPELFSEKNPEKRSIWGEALALRAYIQFDMLRLFAAAPITTPQKKYISYITDYPAYVSTPQSVEECLDSIINDLSKSAQLVWSLDSMRGNQTPHYWFEEKRPGIERFTSVRGYRLNYFAIQATLARVLMYANQTDQALQLATQLINYHQQLNTFNFADNSAQGDMKMYGNILFGLYTPKLTEWERLINDFSNIQQPQCLLVCNVNDIYSPDLKDEEDWYGNITTVSPDYRYKNTIEDFENQGRYYIMRKYTQQTMNTPQAETSNTMIPMIRMTEMYYIAAEIIAKRGAVNSAVDLLCAVKNGRGITDEATLATLKYDIDNNLDNFMKELFRDARREFLGEGQMFFMYKRLNLPIPDKYNRDIEPSEEKFVIPVPKSENV